MNNLTICFLDINSDYIELEEGYDASLEQNLESPKRILEFFLENNIITDYEKIPEDDAEISKRLVYKFKYKVNETRIANCCFEIIFGNSYCENYLLYSDAYIIFINLEDESTLQKLDYLIYFLKDSCQYDVITYFIGVYENKILDSFILEKMNGYFNKKNIYFRYQTMYSGKNKKRLFENKEGIIQSLETVFKTIFDDKCEQDEKKNPDFSTDNLDNYERGKDKSYCYLY